MAVGTAPGRPSRVNTAMPTNAPNRRLNVLELDVPWKDVPEQLRQQAGIGWYNAIHILQEPATRAVPDTAESDPSSFLDELRSALLDTKHQWRHVTIERLGPQLPSVMQVVMQCLLPIQRPCGNRDVACNTHRSANNAAHSRQSHAGDTCHTTLQSLSVVLSPAHHHTFWHNHTADATGVSTPNEWQQLTLQTVFRHIPRSDSSHGLHELNIKCHIEQSTMETLRTALRSSNCTLARLSLYNCKLVSSSSSPPPLPSTQLPSSSSVVSVLADGIRHNTTLREIDVSYCTLCDDDIAVLATALYNHPTITDVDLSGNFCRDVGIASLVRALLAESDGETNTASVVGGQLRSLNLTNQHPSGHHRHGTGPFRIAQLADALQHNTMLRSLDVSFNNLDDSDIVELFVSLRYNTTLQHLNLMKNAITDEGVVRSIAGNLPHMHGLRTLSLMSNRAIGDAGAEALLDAIRHHNTTLCQLKLPRGLVGKDELNYYLSLNHAGRRLVLCRRHGASDGSSSSSLSSSPLMSPPQIPLALWPHVLERSGRLVYQSTWLATARLDVVYYFLHSSPELVLERS